MRLPHPNPNAPENDFTPSPAYMRSWTVYNMIAHGDRTPALLVEAAQYPNIISIEQ